MTIEKAYPMQAVKAIIIEQISFFNYLDVNRQTADNQRSSHRGNKDVLV